MKKIIALTLVTLLSVIALTGLIMSILVMTDKTPEGLVTVSQNVVVTDKEFVKQKSSSRRLLYIGNGDSVRVPSDIYESVSVGDNITVYTTETKIDGVEKTVILNPTDKTVVGILHQDGKYYAVRNDGEIVRISASNLELVGEEIDADYNYVKDIITLLLLPALAIAVLIGAGSLLMFFISIA